MVLCVIILCRLCAPSNFGQLTGVVAGMSSLAGWGHPGGMVRTEVGMGWDSPRALCAEGALVGQWSLNRWISQGICAGVPWHGGWSWDRHGPGCLRVLCWRDAGCPGKLPGAKTVQAWNVLGCCAPLSPWGESCNCSKCWAGLSYVPCFWSALWDRLGWCALGAQVLLRW